MTTLFAGVLLAVVATISLSLGAEPLRLRDVLAALFQPEDVPETTVTIVRNLRAPRILVAVIAGAGLGCAGAGYQGLFRNPLADPFVIGASSGAALGATIAIILGMNAYYFGMGVVSVGALLGAVVAVLAVYGIARTHSATPTVSMVLAGVVVSSFLSALVSLLMFLNEDQLIAIFSWLMGSFSGRGWPIVFWSLGLIGLGSGAVWLASRPLDALTFGDESSQTLGLNLTGVRLQVIAGAGLATGAAVAAGGVIGFVGLIAPHVARALVGPRHAILIPASGILGGLLLLVADDVARLVRAPAELPVGVITALLGGPFFLYLLRFRSQQFAPGDA